MILHVRFAGSVLEPDSADPGIGMTTAMSVESLNNIFEHFGYLTIVLSCLAHQGCKLQ